MNPQPQINQELETNPIYKYIVRKPTALIHAKCFYSLQQKKMADVMLRYVQQTLEIDANTRAFTINLKLLKDLSSIQATNNTQIKNALKQLASLQIESNILGKDWSRQRSTLTPFYSVKLSKPAKGKPCFVTFRIADEILERIQNPKNFSKFNILLIPHLKGVCYPIYQVLEQEFQQETQNETLIPIEKYKEIIGVEKNDYKRFRDFKRKKIEPLKQLQSNQNIAIENLNYELIQDNKHNVTHLKIIHQWKNQKRASELEVKISNKLTFHGFSPEEIWPFLSGLNKPLTYILEKIEGLEQQYHEKFHLVKNRKGLIKQAIEKNYSVSNCNLTGKISKLIDTVSLEENELTQLVKDYLMTQTEEQLQKIREAFISFVAQKYTKKSLQYNSAVKNKHRLEKQITGGRFSKFVYVSYLLKEV